jgi:two-component system sensor histidine kinase DesK
MRIRLLPDSPLGWTPYAWLIYLSVFLAYTAAEGSAQVWMIDGAAVALFLLLYFRAHWVQDTAVLRIALAIVVLGVIYSPRNPGASVFFVYGASFVGNAVRPGAAVRWLAVIVATLGLEAWLIPLPPQCWVPGIIFSIVIGGSNIHYAEVRRKDEALLQAHQRAEHLAAVAERERIARDLHDLLGHTLSVIVIKSELAAKLAERDSVRAAQEIREVERISRNALNEVRQAVHGYRGERLDQELANARTALEAAGVSLTTAIDPVAIGANEERALALGVREAITNVIRHARASHCSIALRQHDGTIVLVIEDDGVGGTAEVVRDTTVGTRLTLAFPERSTHRTAALALS